MLPQPRNPIARCAALTLALLLATRAPAAPIIWGSEGPGVEPVGMMSVDVETGSLVGSGDLYNYGNADADNLVELTFVAPDGYVLDVRYPGATGWFFDSGEANQESALPNVQLSGSFCHQAASSTTTSHPPPPPPSPPSGRWRR